MGGFKKNDLRNKLKIGKMYKIKSSIGRDDARKIFISARLIGLYDNYGLFDTGKYKTGILYFNMATGEIR